MSPTPFVHDLSAFIPEVKQFSLGKPKLWAAEELRIAGSTLNDWLCERSTPAVLSVFYAASLHPEAFSLPNGISKYQVLLYCLVTETYVKFDRHSINNFSKAFGYGNLDTFDPSLEALEELAADYPTYFADYLEEFLTTGKKSYVYEKGQPCYVTAKQGKILADYKTAILRIQLKQGLTVNEFARRVGVNFNTVKKWLEGQITPSKEESFAMANTFPSLEPFRYAFV